MLNFSDMARSLFFCIILVCPSLLYGKVVFVKQDAQGQNNGSNWVHAFTELYDALSVAQYGDSIWVAKGTYSPYVPGISISFKLLSGVRMFGGFNGTEALMNQRNWVSNETTLSGLIDTNYRLPNVIYAENTDSTTILDGFTIRDGLAEIFNGTACDDDINQYHCHGGGIYLFNNNPATPTFLKVKNCKFIDNGARYGGGIAVNFATGSGGLIVKNCHFEHNGCSEEGGAIWLSTGSNPQFTVSIDSCRFENNYGYLSSGIFILNYYDFINLNIGNCHFQNNNAYLSCGALYIGNGGRNKPLVDRCVFVNNSAGKSSTAPGRGGALLGSNYRVNNSVFFQNSAYNGGAVSGGNIEIYNSLFLKNKAFKEGGAMRLSSRAILLNNSFVDNFAENLGGAIRHVGYMKDTIVNCIFYGNTAGENGHWISSNFAYIYLDNSIIDVDDCLDLKEGLDMNYDTLICGSRNIFNLINQFHDTLSGDYRLIGCSLALNAGDSSWVNRFGLLTDLAGNPRILDGLPDIGAYETRIFQPQINHTDISCFSKKDGSATVIPAGGFGPYVYSWSTGHTDIKVDSLAFGEYNVAIQDIDGCLDTLYTTILEPQPLKVTPIVTDATAPMAMDGGIELQSLFGGTAPYVLHWSTGDTINHLQNLSPGLYQLTIVDANGCDTILEMEVKISVSLPEKHLMHLSAMLLPNPVARGSVPELLLKSPGTATLIFSVSDAAGKLLRRELALVPSGQSIYKISVALSPGTYFISIADQKFRDQSVTFKLFVL